VGEDGGGGGRFGGGERPADPIGKDTERCDHQRQHGTRTHDHHHSFSWVFGPANDGRFGHFREVTPVFPGSSDLA
jgi:hypothetical protein